MVMTNISKSFQDYDDDDLNISFRKNRWKYWNQLRLEKIEFMENKSEFDWTIFTEYIQAKYGIKMNIINGTITDNYQIVDEQKYLVFLLKFQ